MKHILKKGVVGLICALIFGAGLYAPATAPRAYAFPVTIVGDFPSTLKWVGDAVAWTAAKAVVQSLTQSVVNWINSGFEGSPAFVTDLEENLTSLGDAVAEDFLRGLDDVVEDNTGISIRAPFQDEINRTLRAEYYRTTSSYGFNERFPYTDCYRGRGFSLNGWFCESQNPANNPYGRYQLARNELFRQLDSAAQRRITELGWGKGFLSWRGPCGRHGTEAAATGVNLSRRESNAACPIRTPGAVIENALGITTTSPLRQLELADSVNEIVGALMTQMVSQVLGGGGLSGLSQPSPGGGPSYLQRTASASDGFAQNISQVRGMITTYQSGWQKIANAATNARQACANNSARSAEATAVLNTANARLAEAGTTLTTLSNIDAERIRLSNSSASDSAINTLVSSFNDLLSRTRSLAEAEAESQDTGNAEPGSLYSQMTRLAASCR